MPTTFSAIVKVILAVIIASTVGIYFIGTLLQPLMDEHDRVVTSPNKSSEQSEEKN